MIKILPMQKKHVFEIIKLYKDIDKEDSKMIKHVYTNYYSKPKRKKGVKDFVIIKDKEVIGFSGYSKEQTETSDIYWINWTGIKKEYQKRGFGTKILKHILKEIKKLKGRKVYVSTSNEDKYKSAIKFYKSLKFKQEGKLKDYYKKSVDMVMLGLKL